MPDSVRAAPSPEVKRPRWPYVVACLIGLWLALGFAYAAWSLAEDGRRWAAIGRAADGVITGYKEVQHTGRRGRRTTYHPSVRYRIQDGKEIEGTTAEALDLDDIHEGQVIRLIYDPGNPTDVHLSDAIAGLATAPWYMGGVALVVCIPSVIGLFRLFRPRAS